MYNLKNLETDGYCVIPNFLSAEELESIHIDYESNSSASNKNYKVKIPSNKVMQPFFNKMMSVSAKISSETSVKVDMITGESMYTDTSQQMFEWHQDHESYWVFNNPKNYINFYIPVIKPNEYKSGLSVVSMKTLEEKFPDFFKKVNGSSARAYYIEDNKTKMIDANDDTITILDFNLDDLEVVIPMNPGDLLLLRGDVIHKSQDNLTRRLAVSVRMADSSMIISKGGLFDNLSTRKKAFIMNNPPWYKMIFSYFIDNNIDSATAKDIFEKYHKSAGNIPL